MVTMNNEPDYSSLSREQLIARLQIATSEHKHLAESNKNLHKMIDVLRENGWATPRGVERHVTIRDYPMDHARQGGGDRGDMARKLAEANERADHWRKKYMDLLDQTGRAR